MAEMYMLSAVIKSSKVILSKTRSQKDTVLKDQKFKKYDVIINYDKEYDPANKIKAITIRVTIPKENGKLFGYDIRIPPDGEIDEKRIEMDVTSDTIEVKIVKTNDFSLEDANM